MTVICLQSNNLVPSPGVDATVTDNSSFLNQRKGKNYLRNVVGSQKYDIMYQIKTLDVNFFRLNFHK